MAEEAKQTPGQRVDRVIETARTKVATAGEKAKEYGGEVKEYVVEHPGKSLVVAAAIGFLLGLLVGRRD